MKRLRPAGPLPDRHHAARGQRRHRQDVRRRRPGHPLRRRRRRRPRPDAGDHLRPGRQPGAARAGARAAGAGRRRWPTSRVAVEPGTTGDRHLLDTDDDGGRCEQRAGCATRCAGFDAATIATTHQFCQMVLRSLGVAGDTDAGAALVEYLDELVVEVVDDLYLAHVRTARGRPAVRLASDALTLARAVVGDPCAELRPEDADAGFRRGRAARVRARGARRGRPPQAALRDPLLRRPARPARRRPGRRQTHRPASGCGSAGGSCWSTSSRTPTRCSGRCSTGRSPGTPRWC